MSIRILSAHEARTALWAPYFISKVPAGFPSPADDYMEQGLDLNEYLIQHPAATFYCRVSGHSMKDIGIMDGCLLIVDRAVEPANRSIVLAVIDGEITCKMLDTNQQRLLSANNQYAPTPISAGSNFEVEGVVIHAINSYVGNC